MIFYYTGFDRQGIIQYGYINDPYTLLNDHIVITNLKPVDPFPPKTLTQQINFFIALKQLTEHSNMIHQIIEKLIASQSKYVPWLMVILNKIEYGLLFSQAMKETKHHFDIMTINMIVIGEYTSSLNKSIENIILHLQHKKERVLLIQQKARYPIFLLFILLLFISIFIIFIYPYMLTLYRDQASAQDTYMWYIYKYFYHIFLYIFLAIIFIKVCVRRYKTLYTKILFYIPIIKNIMTHEALIELFNSLFLLESHQIIGVQALEIISQSSSYDIVTDHIKYMIIDVQDGNSFLASLCKCNTISKDYRILLESVEHTNNYTKIYKSIVDQLKQEQKQCIDKIDTYIQPVLILLIGFMILAAYYSIISQLYLMI